jgi:hypothetical protein
MKLGERCSTYRKIRVSKIARIARGTPNAMPEVSLVTWLMGPMCSSTLIKSSCLDRKIYSRKFFVAQAPIQIRARSLM